MKNTNFSAIILAAGFSSRMEAFKPLIRIAGKSFVEHAIALFHTSGIQEIITVVGHRAQEVLPVIQTAASRCVINENFADGMYSSVRAGIKALKHPGDAFFLLPVDIPLVQPTTVRRLAVAFDQHSAPPVCYPLFRSKCGHPPLINSRLINALLSYGGRGGLREFLRGYEDRAISIPVADPFIRMDADTSQDLLRLKQMMHKRRLGIEACGEQPAL
jgi:molybdenum cofactor cytidylyltransferase